MGSRTPTNIPNPAAYWNVNIPPSDQTIDCPPYLSQDAISSKDQEILATPDSEYHVLTWPEVQKYIHTNRLDLFQRTPSDLRRYMAYNYATKQKYGSIMTYVLEHKLKWSVPVMQHGAKGEYFKHTGDWSVKWNDWPYGIDERITHLVVWTKFDLDEDPTNPLGDLSTECRTVVNEFVQETFASAVGQDNVIWFKNWRALKSVQAVEHFHIMLYDADPAFIERITQGDMPMMEVLRASTT